MPVWYALNASCEPDYDHPLLPSEDVLPVDPSIDCPAGYTNAQRNQPNGFIADLDVLDTWATSSLTPQLASLSLANPHAWEQLRPFDLRPQGQDIIRTWLFCTVLQQALCKKEVPWKNVAISGFILDPDRKKMSKSKGNTVTPIHLLKTYGSDAVRYWAASAQLGFDASFNENNPTQIKIGRRLAIKIANATKLTQAFGAFSPDVLGFFDSHQHATRVTAAISQPIDIDMLVKLKHTIVQATCALTNFEHSKALALIENLFWLFCDHYLECIKDRAYNGNATAQKSAIFTSQICINAFLHLFAPFLPFITEEAWNTLHTESIHTNKWPVAGCIQIPEETQVLDFTIEVITLIRGYKTSAKVSQNTQIAHITLRAPKEKIDAVGPAVEDIKSCCKIADITFLPDDTGVEFLLDSVQLADKENT